MTCPTCGAENPESARFCAQCGGRLAASCGSCGAELSANARFCGACGEPAATAVPPEPASGAGGGDPERRRVSILFVDLVDFTALAESLDPEDVRRVQSRYFETARSIVARYGGTIEKFIGDAVMAVWGAPIAHEDDAERATRCAAAVTYAVARLSVGPSGAGLRARAAVATGEVAVVLDAPGQGMVSGDLVNVAARLQSRAPAGGVLVDGPTRDRAGGAGSFEAVGSLALRGRTERLAAFRLAAGSTDPISRHRSAHGGEFVGRERELRELTGLLRSVIDEGRGRLVSIAGVAGIGKSRLAWELGSWADALETDVAWHEGWAPAYGEGIAFAPVAQMLRRRIRVSDGTPPELARRLLATALVEFVPDEAERRWIEPRLAPLLAPEDVAAFDRDELFAAWRRFFERVADRMPTVLVFEDLQWADASLVEFIDHLATWTRQRPILIVTLARPEFGDQRPDWGAGVPSHTTLRLERLDDDAMRKLLTGRAPDLDPSLVTEILSNAGGVPLYAVEMARMLEGSPAASGDRRRARRGPGVAPARVSVPDSLHGLIAARIDALPADDRRLLLTAAVLGPRFRPEALLDVAGGEPARTRERLAHLLRRELLVVDEEVGSPSAGQVSFVQDLVREVAYGTLSRSERRAMHLAAARHLESLGDEVAESLSGHLVEAHDLTTDAREKERLARRAVAALRHAAQQARALHVPDRSLGHLERALRLRTGAEQRAPLLEAAADSARAAGRMEVAEQHLRELITIQDATRQRSEAARTRARLASVLLSAQRNEPALAELESAMRSVRGWARDAGGVELAAQLARARLLTGDDEEALAWARRALEAAERLGLGAITADLLVTRGTAQLSLGAEEAGAADLRTAIERAREIGSLHVELRARNNLAWSLLDDDPREALTTAREGFILATEMGIGDAAVPLADIACTASVETGGWAWALTTISEIREQGVSDAYGIVLDATESIIRGLRGDARPLSVLDRHGALADDTDPGVVAAVKHARAVVALCGGELDRAGGLGDAAVDGYAGSDPSYQRALPARAALWSGDRAGAATRLARLEAGARRGRAAQSTAATLRAGVDALDGAATAADAYRRVGEGWIELGMPVQRILALADEHLLVGSRSAALEGRRLADELGAGGLARLFAARRAAMAVSRPAGPARRARLRPPNAGTARPTGAGRRKRPATDRRPPRG